MLYRGQGTLAAGQETVLVGGHKVARLERARLARRIPEDEFHSDNPNQLTHVYPV